MSGRDVQTKYIVCPGAIQTDAAIDGVLIGLISSEPSRETDKSRKR